MEKDRVDALKKVSPWFKEQGNRYVRCPLLSNVRTLVYLHQLTTDHMDEQWFIGILLAKAIEKKMGIPSSKTHKLHEAQSIVDQYLIDEGYELISQERWERIQLLS